MKKISIILLLSILAIPIMTGCSDGNSSSGGESSSVQSTESDAAETTSTSAAPQQGFDIEAARKAIIIKGQHFEIPVALKDLTEGWTYELYPEEEVYLGEGLSLARMYYDDEEMFIASLENYAPDKAEESIIYNLTVNTDDCSIAAFTPLVSTKQEVVDRYGEPTETDSFQSPFLDSYSYGMINGYDENGRLNNQSISFQFTEEGIVKSISITFAASNYS